MVKLVQPFNQVNQFIQLSEYNQLNQGETGDEIKEPGSDMRQRGRIVRCGDFCKSTANSQ
jgi:hypothetical protein